MAVLKRSKKIAKLSMILMVRQVWGLVCNLYLLTYQPFLTLRTMRARRDKSQILLISIVAMSPFFAYIAARAILDLWWYGRWQPNVGAIFGLTVLMEMIILGYLGYWTMEVINKNHKDQFRVE